MQYRLLNFKLNKHDIPSAFKWAVSNGPRNA